MDKPRLANRHLVVVALILSVSSGVALSGEGLGKLRSRVLVIWRYIVIVVTVAILLWRVRLLAVPLIKLSGRVIVARVQRHKG